MCFKIFVDLIMIWNFLSNRKYDEHQFEIYLYILFICTQMRFVRKRKICYIYNFVNFKYLINENILTFIIGLLAHSLLLIIFKCPKP